MRANELRIGSIVFLQGKGVYEIDSGHDLDEIDSFPIQNDYCQGIPLTEYWLLKLGFTEYKNEDDLFGWEKDGFIYMNDCMIGLKGVFIGEESYIMPNFNGAFKYVHQLQNIYRSLMGTELTLKP